MPAPEPPKPVSSVCTRRPMARAGTSRSRSISRQKDDLTFLVQRGEGLADRLDELVRASRPALANAEQSVSRASYAAPSYAAPSYAPQIERGPQVERGTREEPKVRSQAERDLLKALRMIR